MRRHSRAGGADARCPDPTPAPAPRTRTPHRTPHLALRTLALPSDPGCSVPPPRSFIPDMRPVLRPGDGGDHVKNLQRGLNKLGEMLLVDGQFGPVTQEAVAAARSALALPGPPVADARLTDALAELPDPFPSCTASGVTFIAREEVISAANYRRHRQAPTWPQPGYGITIGIGYSLLCAAPPEVFTSDWGGQLPPATID